MPDTPTKRRRTVATSLSLDSPVIKFDLFNPPDGPNGTPQSIGASRSLNYDDIPDKYVTFMTLRGLATTFANSYDKLTDPSAADIAETFDKLVASLKDGTWTPGRTFEAGEPDDIVLAVAEVTGQPVHLIEQRFAELLAEPQLDNFGAVMLDKRGRVLHVRTRARFYADLEAGEPRIKVALAKIARERAARLTAEAKTAKPTGTLTSLFGEPAAAAQ